MRFATLTWSEDYPDDIDGHLTSYAIALHRHQPDRFVDDVRALAGALRAEADRLDALATRMTLTKEDTHA